MEKEEEFTGYKRVFNAEVVEERVKVILKDELIEINYKKQFEEYYKKEIKKERTTNNETFVKSE